MFDVSDFWALGGLSETEEQQIQGLDFSEFFDLEMQDDNEFFDLGFLNLQNWNNGLQLVALLFALISSWLLRL